MKTIISLFALLVSTGALAQTTEAPDATCSYVCSGLSSPSAIRQCRAIAADGEFQRSACDVCDSIRFDDSRTVACMDAIQDKTYSTSEIRSCSAYGSASAIVRCLQTSGRPSHGGGGGGGGGGHCDIARLQRQADGALSNLRGRNYQAVENTLNNMKDELRSCR